MALKECFECNGKVSELAKLCPHCGASQRKPMGASGLIFIAVIAFLLITFIFKTNYKNEQISYEASIIPGEAQYETLSIPSDARAVYKIIEKGFNGNNPVIIFERYTAASGKLFTKTEFDCTNYKYKVMAESDNYQNLKDKQINTNMVDIVEGSIKYWQMMRACQ